MEPGSRDGALVASRVREARLAGADTDASPDVYRYGVRSRATALVSGAPGIVTCAPEAAASRRGRFIAFACDLVVLVYDHRRGITQVVAPSGERPLISADAAAGRTGTSSSPISRATGAGSRSARPRPCSASPA